MYPEAYAAFVEMEANAANVQAGDIKPIDPNAPHFFESEGDLFFEDVDGDGFMFDGDSWAC